jgi:hypothetical protein
LVQDAQLHEISHSQGIYVVWAQVRDEWSKRESNTVLVHESSAETISKLFYNNPHSCLKVSNKCNYTINFKFQNMCIQVYTTGERRVATISFKEF